MLTNHRYQQYEEAGTDLGQIFSQKKVIESIKTNMPMNVAKAIARVSGGIYVVTAKKGDSRGAMIASWVSQVCNVVVFESMYCSTEFVF